jgi:hypothetical protein
MSKQYKREGGGISFDGSSGVRIAPEDFLVVE